VVEKDDIDFSKYIVILLG